MAALLGSEDGLAILLLLFILIAFCVAGTMDYEDRVNNLNDMMPSKEWYLHD